MKNDYVCADCGHEQDSMARLCDACSSVRVVSIKAIENLLGEDWRKAFANARAVPDRARRGNYSDAK